MPMVDANDLRLALADRDGARARVEQITSKRRELDAQYVAACDALVASREARDIALASEILGEAADVAAARLAYDAASEQCAGLERAIDMLRDRAAAADTELVRAEDRVVETMAALAAPLVDGARSDVEFHAKALADALRTFHKLDNCARRGGGFLSGQAAERAAGMPGTIITDAGMLVHGGMITSRLTERADDLRPQQLLSLLSE